MNEVEISLFISNINIINAESSYVRYPAKIVKYFIILLQCVNGSGAAASAATTTLGEQRGRVGRPTCPTAPCNKRPLHTP